MNTAWKGEQRGISLANSQPGTLTQGMLTEHRVFLHNIHLASQHGLLATVMPSAQGLARAIITSALHYTQSPHPSDSFFPKHKEPEMAKEW